jgi:predicted RNA-binding Zn-ribbon protein involved in translation (DUF1610 family)
LEFLESSALSLWRIPRNSEIVRRIKKKTETEIFVCDNCGNRKRLPSNQRHWCDNCTFGVPVEMRCAKDKWKRPREPAPVADEKRF